jgi:iron complex outermembrane receptor protein
MPHLLSLFSPLTLPPSLPDPVAYLEKHMKNKHACTLCLLFAAAPLQAADPVILVEDTTLPAPATQTWLPEDIELAPVSDGGELLRDIPGLSGARMGGRGIDPIIRGQSQNRLNILLDGAYVHGGCPNRMDPPTAYSSMNSYDSITVIKGSQTVVYGGGGSGGTVLFERITPRFNAGETYRAEATAGYKSNSETKQYGADVAAGNQDWFVRGIVDYTDANNYEDGDGNTVRSAYTNKDGIAILGFTPDADTRLELSYEANREDDVLYAGSMMDAPYSDNDTTRLKFTTGNPVGPFAGVKAELYYSEIDHKMDNYSLRPPPANPMMKMETPSSSDTGGGRLSGDIHAGNGMVWTVGADYQKNNRDADRFSGATLANLQSIIWPDAQLEQSGVFAEMARPLSDANKLKAGLRFDYVDASAGRADEDATVAPPMNGTPALIRSPEDLYSSYYGTRDTDNTEHNLGGFVTLEHMLDPGSAVYATLSRTVRTADATERFIASDNSMANMIWVGNPDLDPEQHHQLELGYTRDAGAWDTAASVYYNDVSDYILRDRAHNQDGILQGNNATIYRNVDAELYGFEMEAGIRWASYWSSRATLAYVHARNSDDSRPIAQMPPLNGTVSLEYTRGDWNLGGLVRAEARQDRVEDDPFTDSGQDAGKTPGWGTLDLFGRYEGAEHVSLAAGINNVFDRNYAYHVNSEPSPFDPNAVQVNEPGREYWLRLSASF